VVIWSSSTIAIKGAFTYVDPLAFMLLRFIGINLLAWAVLAAQRARTPGLSLRVDRADFGQLLLASLTGYTLYQVGYVLGLERTSVFTLSLLLAMVPLFTMVLLSLRGEPIPPYGWIGLAVAAGGVAVFLGERNGGHDTLAGIALSLVAAVAFAVYGVASRPLVKRYPSAVYSAYSLAFGTLPMIAIAGPAMVDQRWGEVPLRIWLGTFYTIVFPVYVAYQLWNFAIRHRGAAAASSYGLAVPVLSGVLAAIVFDEGFGGWKLAGAAFVFAGLAIVRMERLPWAGRGVNLRTDA
jgi:drug/metabolite transporter (DMT)-like permease